MVSLRNGYELFVLLKIVSIIIVSYAMIMQVQMLTVGVEIGGGIEQGQ